MTASEALHRLIEGLREDDVEVASRVLGGLEARADPILGSLELETEAHRHSLAVATSPHAEEDQEFIEAVSEDFVSPRTVQGVPPRDRARNRS